MVLQLVFLEWYFYSEKIEFVLIKYNIIAVFGRALRPNNQLIRIIEEILIATPNQEEKVLSINLCFFVNYLWSFKIILIVKKLYYIIIIKIFYDSK